MKGFKKYPHIDNLNKRSEILDYSVVVTEKLHGTNVRMMSSGYLTGDHGLVLGSRNNVIYRDLNVAQGLYGFVDHVLKSDIFSCLEKYTDYVFYGEWFGPGIQKGLNYGPEKQFRIFDIRNPAENFLDWENVKKICEELGFATPPVLLEGHVEIADLEEIREIESFTGREHGVSSPENFHEGMVIKPAKMQRDRRGNWTFAKYKSKKWAENAGSAKPKNLSPEKLKAQERARKFADIVVTPGRTSTIVDHITRDGNEELNIRRMGDFLRALVNDVMTEHKVLYDKLDKDLRKRYNKAVSTNASQAFKEYLEER